MKTWFRVKFRFGLELGKSLGKVYVMSSEVMLTVCVCVYVCVTHRYPKAKDLAHTVVSFFPMLLFFLLLIT